MSFYSGPLAADANTSYLFENNAGLIVYAYGYGDQISYYYQAASAMRTLDIGFYVNDIHYQELDNNKFCPGDMTFRAEIQGELNIPTGNYLRWYIDGVEEVPARNNSTGWIKNMSVGTYEIKMEADMVGGSVTKTVVGTLTISPCTIPINPHLRGRMKGN
jgi:hypothetical protein